jgi:hypothetical protein
MVAPALALVAIAALRRAGREGAAPLARTAAALSAVAGVPLASVLLWTRWADSVKAASPATAWITSERLRGWNFGSLQQRLDPHAWGEIGARLPYIVPGLLLGAVALAFAAPWRRRGPARAAIAAAAAGGLLPVLTFFNLFFVHDYYLISVTPCLALLAGAGAAELAALRLPRRGAVLAALAAATAASSLPTYRYARPAWEDLRRAPVVALARLVAEVTPPDRWVVVEGDDWSPVIPYLSHRLAFMVRPPFVPVTLVADRPEVGTIVCASCTRDLLDRWPDRTFAGRAAGFDVYPVGGGRASRP